MLRKLDRAIQLLADQPRLGRPYEHRGHLLRVLTHGDYRVFYREQGGELTSGQARPRQEMLSDGGQSAAALEGCNNLMIGRRLPRGAGAS